MNAILFGVGSAIIVLASAATWKAPRLMVALLWSLATAILVISALFNLLDAPVLEKGSWAFLALPCVWVTLQFWAYWDSNKWRVCAGIGTIALTSILVVVFGPKPI